MKAKWLFSKRPLVVDVDLASAIGLNEAIVVQQLNYWLHSKSAKQINGRMWIYNTYANWKKDNFPFWSTRTIRRALDKCIKKKIILTGNFNKAGFDKTKWYSIDFDELNKLVARRCGQNGQTEWTKWPDGSGQNGQTNTRDYTETTTDTTNKGRKSRKAKQYDHDSPEYQTARYLYELIITNNEKFKKPHLQRWADTVRLMHERDGRSFEDIRAVANYAQHSSFWMSNVLSMNKLRKQFDRLYMQAKKAKPQPKEKDWSSWDNYGR